MLGQNIRPTPPPPPTRPTPPSDPCPYPPPIQRIFAFSSTVVDSDANAVLKEKVRAWDPCPYPLPLTLAPTPPPTAAPGTYHCSCGQTEPSRRRWSCRTRNFARGATSYPQVGHDSRRAGRDTVASLCAAAARRLGRPGRLRKCPAQLRRRLQTVRGVLGEVPAPAHTHVSLCPSGRTCRSPCP